MPDTDDRSSGEDETVVAAVQAGDNSTFAALAERHRRELRVHCYRMLANKDDADDLVQETFVRAWRSRDRFEGRSTFRAWLYRIATNACLDALRRQRRRVQVMDGAPGNDHAPFLDEVPWLQPFPDRLLGDAAYGEGPDAVVVAKETIELAFMAAIQHLPHRPRAVLILRDVLGWSARETVEALNGSVPAVNSAFNGGGADCRSSAVAGDSSGHRWCHPRRRSACSCSDTWMPTPAPTPRR